MRQRTLDARELVVDCAEVRRNLIKAGVSGGQLATFGERDSLDKTWT